MRTRNTVCWMHGSVLDTVPMRVTQWQCTKRNTRICWRKQILIPSNQAYNNKILMLMIFILWIVKGKLRHNKIGCYKVLDHQKADLYQFWKRRLNFWQLGITYIPFFEWLNLKRSTQIRQIKKKRAWFYNKRGFV